MNRGIETSGVGRSEQFFLVVPLVQGFWETRKLPPFRGTDGASGLRCLPTSFQSGVDVRPLKTVSVDLKGNCNGCHTGCSREGRQDGALRG